ncbi:MAG: sialidase family protein [Gallionellaceae bacterium]|nr:sialidase family protein [Gallionellaceae bacterium]
MAFQPTVGPNVQVSLGGTETTIAINPLDPGNLVGTGNFAHYTSLDYGATGTSTSSSGTYGYGADPNIAFDTDGNAYRQELTWLSSTLRAIRIGKYTNKGQTLSATYMAYQPKYKNGIYSGNPDQGWLAIDTNATSPRKNYLYTVWSDYPSQGATTSVQNVKGIILGFTRSTDRGATWSTPIDISSTLAGGQEHSSSIATGPNGEVYVAWINGGNTTTQYGLYFNKSTDGGVTWGADTFIRSLQGWGSWPGVPDVRANPKITVDPTTGTIYIASGEPNTSGGFDSSVIRSTDGGYTWSSPVLLSDGLQGAYKYYFQPTISVAPNGRIDAVWYDTRSNVSTVTGEYAYNLYYSYSTDGGISFAPSIRVSNRQSWRENPCVLPCDSRVLYEYQGIASSNDRVHALWADTRDSSTGQTGSAYTAQIHISSAPDVVTKTATNIATTSATFNASISTWGLTDDVQFEYGLTAALGSVTGNTSVTTPIGQTSTVSMPMSGLTANKTYYYRAFGYYYDPATGTTQTTYGATQTFKTPRR